MAERNKAADQNRILKSVVTLQGDTIEKFKRERTITVTMSMYTASSRECDSSPKYTATEAKTTVGRTLAVSRDLMWMLGHRVYIHGHGVFVVEDVMHHRWRNKVDLLVGNYKTALKFGVQQVKIEVLGKEVNVKKKG